MEIEQWLKIALLCTLGAMSPGPSLAVILNNTLYGGKSTGIYTSLLHGLGVGSYALLVVTSTSLALQRYPLIESLLEISGACLLCWLALQSWPRETSQNLQDQVNQTSIFSPSLGTIFGWQYWLGLAVMVGVIDAVWYILVVLIASTSLFQISDDIWRMRIGKLMSIVMAFIALEIIIKHISSVL